MAIIVFPQVTGHTTVSVQNYHVTVGQAVVLEVRSLLCCVLLPADIKTHFPASLSGRVRKFDDVFHATRGSAGSSEFSVASSLARSCRVYFQSNRLALC